MQGHSRRFTVLWTVWMGACAIVLATLTYAVTRSLGWTVVALLAAGPIGNAIGQVVVQPYSAAKGARRPRS